MLRRLSSQLKLALLPCGWIHYYPNKLALGLYLFPSQTCFAALTVLTELLMSSSPSKLSLLPKPCPSDGSPCFPMLPVAPRAPTIPSPKVTEASASHYSPLLPERFANDPQPRSCRSHCFLLLPEHCPSDPQPESYRSHCFPLLHVVSGTRIRKAIPSSKVTAAIASRCCPLLPVAPRALSQ